MSLRSSAPPALLALLLPATLGAALTLTGCVAKGDPDTAIAVHVTDTDCTVARNTAAAGNVRFKVTNAGTAVNEFEVLGSDKVRIFGERENITPGQSVDFIVQLQPGSYFTGCKFKQVGAPTGLAPFTVTGSGGPSTSATAIGVDAAVTTYVGYVRAQVAQLVPAVTQFAADYSAGRDDAARTGYPRARVFWERIEPTAEAFGDIDPKIDSREVDVSAGEDWTGFHRIEKDLWPPAAGALNSDGADAHTGWTASSPAQRASIAAQLNADVATLAARVNDPTWTVTVADITNGAAALLEEVVKTKITGEEDWWSGTDLWDFAGNVDGAHEAYTAVIPILTQAGGDAATLVTTLRDAFAGVNAALATFGSTERGFPNYTTVTEAQRKHLSDVVNALAEPLSKLTHAAVSA